MNNLVVTVVVLAILTVMSAARVIYRLWRWDDCSSDEGPVEMYATGISVIMAALCITALIASSHQLATML